MRTASWFIALAACFLAGCASPWERHFVSESWPAATVAGPPICGNAPPLFREASWERVQAALGELHKGIRVSDACHAEWPPEQRADAKARLLTGLGVSEDPAQITVLGRSTFRQSRPPAFNGRPGRDLYSFARQIGARRVVWSRTTAEENGTIEYVAYFLD